MMNKKRRRRRTERGFIHSFSSILLIVSIHPCKFSLFAGSPPPLFTSPFSSRASWHSCVFFCVFSLMARLFPLFSRWTFASSPAQLSSPCAAFFVLKLGRTKLRHALGTKFETRNSRFETQKTRLFRNYFFEIRNAKREIEISPVHVFNLRHNPFWEEGCERERKICKWGDKGAQQRLGVY